MFLVNVVLENEVKTSLPDLLWQNFITFILVLKICQDILEAFYFHSVFQNKPALKQSQCCIIKYHNALKSETKSSHPKTKHTPFDYCVFAITFPD